LYQVGIELGPGLDGGEADEFVVDHGELLVDVVQGLQVLAQAQGLGRREVEAEPPVAVLGGKELAFGWGKIVTVKEAVQAVAGAGADLNQTSPMGNEGAEFANVGGRDPDLRDEVGDEQASQGQGVALVGLDPRCRDELDLVGIGHQRFAHQGGNDVVQVPGVGGSFDEKTW
jgi:hypothetical protein